MPASRLGKIKMVAQVVAILALILAHGADGQRRPLFLIGHAGLWVVMLTALASAVDYFRRFNDLANRRIADFSAGRDQRSDRKAG